MNDDFSFDGANAANMPLDLSFSSQPLPEGEAATGFHLPEITPAQEQAKADSPKLVDAWIPNRPMKVFTELSVPV